MTTNPKISDIPNLKLPPFGREAIQAARHYAETGIFIPFLTPTQVINTKAQLTGQERLNRGQAIIRKRLHETCDFETLRLSPDPLTLPTDELADLETWFAVRDMPSGSIKLNAWTTIADIRKAITYHLEAARIDSGKPSGQIDLNHLREIKACLEALEKPP